MAYSGKKSIDAIFREVRNAVFKTGGGKLVKDGDGRRYLNDDVCVPTGNLSGYDSGKSGFSGSEYDDSGETVKVVYTDGFGTQKDADIKLSRATGEFAGLMSPGDKESLETMVGNNVTHLKVNKSTVDGKEAYLVDPGNLPSYVDDVVEGYYRSSDGKFYGTAVDDLSEPVSGVYDTIEKTVSTGGKTAIGTFYRTYSDEITGETGKIYVNLGDSDHKIYRYSGSTYVLISDVPEATLKEIEKKVDTSTFNSYKNATGATLQEMDSAIANAGNMQEVTYARLVELRGSGGLVAGTQYRITDFVTTVGSGVEHVRSAGHQFDVIVTADSAGTLNDVARAALHSGDEYFLNSKLRAWKIWYSLDNETGRFNWADGENGKGVIYRMIDEFGNDLPFDFKNVQFEMYHVDEVLSKDAYMSSTMNSSSLYSSKWWFADAFYSDPVSVTEDESGNKSYNGTDSNLWGGVVYGSSGTAVTIDSYSGKYSASLGDDKYVTFITSGSRTSMYAYAFSQLTDITSTSPVVTDLSLSNMAVTGNAVAATSNSAAAVNDFSLRRLPEVVFWGYACHFNTVGCNNHYISFEENAQGNRAGSNCQSNIIGGSYNALHDSCRCNVLYPNSCYNAIGSGGVGNYLYSMCMNNVLGQECRSNVFESQCVYNTLGTCCNDNAFRDSCMYNTLGTDCYSNSLQSSCEGNLLGNGSSSNTLGSGCKFNMLGADCSGNSLDGDHNTLGSRCQRNKVSMRDNMLGNGCVENNVYASGNTLGPSCYNNKLSAAASGNILGYSCQGNSIDGAYNSIGNVNNYNQLGEEANYNRTGNGCSSIHIGRNSSYNVFGEGCESILLATYCNSNVFGEGTSNITINNSAGSSNVIQNYHFKSGITSYTKDNLAGNLAYETIVAKKSDGTIVTYNEADLYTGS